MGLKRISGLWSKSGAKGEFWAGDTREPIPAGAKLMVFANDRKQSSSDPDFTLNMIVDGENGPPPNQQQPTTHRPASTPQRQDRPITSDDRKRAEVFNREVTAVGGEPDVPF